MRFGYQQPSHTFSGEVFNSLGKVASECEALGYDSFWIMDHLVQIDYVGSREEPIMEAFTTLAALATLTEKIKLGPLCACNLFRNPALVAKMGATIDRISGGRFFLGLGAGWFEDEARRYGYAFEGDRTRLARLEEAVQIIDKAWTEERPTFRGRFYSIEDYILSPKPIQKPRPKILIGGEGEKVTLRLVAKYADACNLFGIGEDLERKLEILKRHCKDVGRDYSKILKTKLASVMFADSRDDALKKIGRYKPPWVDAKTYASGFLLGSPSEIARQVSSLRDVGVDYLIVNFRGRYDPEDKLAFSKQVMSRF